ncbi:hypothetical protein GQ43DRAFT_150536 [Delitschia confertaspora ATCC 74209]|uniref:Uncharacterized protein n=1 Tax=Delitschia confertaspora ATCC 74209 TaxID=1513339 RepID=A0A9P4MPU0_9PLEO|nr:hypothetical protein GQ43DRAFT_150536 [Delitschia confertaspora ATCC 74209]
MKLNLRGRAWKESRKRRRWLRRIGRSAVFMGSLRRTFSVLFIGLITFESEVGFQLYDKLQSPQTTVYSHCLDRQHGST